MDEKQTNVPENDQTREAEAQEAEKKSEEAAEEPAKKKKKKDPSETEKLKEELAAEHDRYLRTLAEYDNFRKRSKKEREALYTDVQADTIKKILPVYDNLLRAVAQETADTAYHKGVEMILNQYVDILTKLGVTAIEAVGQPFDANLHNAVMQVSDPELGENVVAEEFEKGFRMGDKVLRPSVVKVANCG